LGIPSGKHTKNDGTSPFLMGKSTISMAMCTSFLYVYQRVYPNHQFLGSSQSHQSNKSKTYTTSINHQ
jgi:hypothetical protein